MGGGGVYSPGCEDDICKLGMGRFPEKVTGCSEGWRSGVCLRVCHWMLGKQNLWSSNRNGWDLHAQTVWVDAYSLQWGAVSGSDHGWEPLRNKVAKGTNTFWACRRAGWGLKQAMVEWLHSANVRLLLAFTALVWRPATEKEWAKKLLSNFVQVG